MENKAAVAGQPSFVAGSCPGLREGGACERAEASGRPVSTSTKDRQASSCLTILPRLGLRAREQLRRHAAAQHLVGGRPFAPLERLAIATKQARPLALACQWRNGEDLACCTERKEAAMRREARRVGLTEQHELLSLHLGHARAERALCW